MTQFLRFKEINTLTGNTRVIGVDKSKITYYSLSLETTPMTAEIHLEGCKVPFLIEWDASADRILW